MYPWYPVMESVWALPARQSGDGARPRCMRMSAAEYFRQAAQVLRGDRQRSAEIEALPMEKRERREALEAKAWPALP